MKTPATVWKCKCERCGAKWVSRADNPKRCAKYKTPYQERKEEMIYLYMILAAVLGSVIVLTAYWLGVKNTEAIFRAHGLITTPKSYERGVLGWLRVKKTIRESGHSKASY